MPAVEDDGQNFNPNVECSSTRHRARATHASNRDFIRLALHAAQQRPARLTGSGESFQEVGPIRARLLLAPASRLQAREHAADESGILVYEIREKRRARRESNPCAAADAL